MKKGIKIVIIVVLVVLIACYIDVKGFCLYVYNNSKFTKDNNDFIWEIKNAFDNRNYITIKKNQNEENDYFYYEGLKIRNDFEKSKNIYKLKGTDIAVTFDKYSTLYLVSLVKEDSKKMGLHYDLTKDLEKNNINTNLKLYEYLFNNMNQKVNFFTSVNNIRKAISVNMALLEVSSSFNKMSVINGDYDGYILENNKSKIVVINHNDISYFITIYSNDYSDESLYNLLSTIIFE